MASNKPFSKEHYDYAIEHYYDMTSTAIAKKLGKYK